MKKIFFVFVYFILVNTLFVNAQIQGIVLDSQSSPIENALVSHLNNPFEYTKTESDGTFVIAGNIGTQLTVAALNYETKTVIINTSNSNIIQLNTDPLLATDVYHISFDHLRPGETYTKDELKQDFPVGYGKGVYQNNDPSTDRTMVDVSMDFNGDGRSLRVKYPAGQVKTENSGIDTRIPLGGVFNNNTFAADELYLSYWMRFSNNFDMEACGGKLPSLGGSNAFEREMEWKGRIMWGAGGSLRFYMELPHDFDGIDSDSIRFLGEKIYDGGSICDNRFTPILTNTQWHQIELHYVLEQNGEVGLFEIWVDGDKAHKAISSEEFGLYRRPGEGMDNLTINAILISSFLGGGTGWEQDEDVYAWFDEFRVSTQRIGGTNSNPPITQQIHLQQGWNLISLYVTPTNNSISNVFPNATMVKNDNGFYKSSIESPLNSIQTIETGEGYLVFNSIDETIEITGSVQTRLIASLQNGWNLIGVPSSSPLPLSTYPNATIIKNFEGFYENGNSLSTVSELQAGKAYYIFKE